jgi:L-asparaginase II
MPESYLPIYELTRGEIVESTHFGAIAIVDSAGKLVAAHGDSQTITYLRSSAKPIQALSFIEHGGQAFFNLTQREIALMCASHSGTDDHVSVVTSIQRKSGVDESDLMCGVHPLSHKPTQEALRQRGEEPTQNRNNCSGKHTGMLAYARMLGYPVEDYINPAHPVQKIITQTFSEMSSVPVDQIQIGIDGCSAPNFAVPLYNAALAIARLVDPENASPTINPERIAACHTIIQAMIHYPDMVGGPDSFDTHLISAAQGRVISKGGAEGYHILGVLPGVLAPGSPGLGIALKISDGDLKSHTRGVGDSRGQIRPAASLEILRQLGALTDPMVADLADYGPTFPVYNWRKVLVGTGRPCFEVARFPKSTPQSTLSYKHGT